MRTLIASIVVTALVAVAAPAAAQAPRSERPYRGLFAGDTGNAEQMLTLSASFGGGYDDNIFASGASVPATSNRAGSTSFLTGSGQLGYSVAKPEKAFSASVGGGAGHYPGLSDPSIFHFNGSVGGSVQLARHSTFSASQSETYQPFYFWSALPTDVAPVDATPVFDPGAAPIADAGQTSLTERLPIVADAVSAASAEYYLASSTSLGYTQGLAEHLTLNLGYAYRRSDSQSGVRNFMSQSGSGRLSYMVAKGVSLKAGYGYTESEYPSANGPGQRYQSNHIDAGVDYNKTLSISRRTTLGFQTGLAGVNDSVQTHYHVVGNIQLTRELGRSWSAGLQYRRSVSYLETFRAPVLSDSLSTSIGGLLSRTAQFQASAGVSRGSVGYGPDNTYQTYHATAGARFAITRKAGLSVYYSYHRYSFEDGIVRPPGVSNFSNRQGVGFSFDTWVPLIQRNRSADATR